MLRPTDAPDRTHGLIAFALALLLSCIAPADEARGQQQQGTTYPDVNEDPDQGQPQADAQEPRGTLFPALEFPWDAKLDAFRKRIYDQYGLKVHPLDRQKCRDRNSQHKRSRLCRK